MSDFLVLLHHLMKTDVLTLKKISRKTIWLFKRITITSLNPLCIQFRLGSFFSWITNIINKCYKNLSDYASLETIFATFSSSLITLQNETFFQANISTNVFPPNHSLKISNSWGNFEGEWNDPLILFAIDMIQDLNYIMIWLFF